MARVTVEQVQKRLARNFYASTGAGHDRFYHDALSALGIVGHPKADKAYQIAYENGHAGGMSEVFGYLMDLAELLRD
jgi:hypothetical protein